MIERWLNQNDKELAQIPYISPDKIRADTRSYAQTLRHYGERFFHEFVRRVCLPRVRGEEREQA